jgi:parvulin-like peptidyl-prolyl isomerase
MYKYFICIILISLLAGGCGESGETEITGSQITRVSSGSDYQLVNSKGEPVLIISGQEITPEDIINKPTSMGDLFTTPSEFLGSFAKDLDIKEFKEKIKQPLLVIVADKISDIILYKSAKKKLGDTLDETLDKAIESEIRRFSMQYGGDQAKADEEIKLKWHDIDSYKKILKREILMQWYISSQTIEENFITYRQLIKQYESMKDKDFVITPMIEFQLIDIQPSKLTISDPNKDRLELAEELADTIYSELKSGGDFSELARQYSHGPKSQSGGLWDPVNPSSLAEPYDLIAKAAKDMNPGQISEPIKTDTHIFILKLLNKQNEGYEPFEKVQEQVRKATKAEQNKNMAISKLNESLVQQMERSETNAFIDYCLEKIYKQNNQK